MTIDLEAFKIRNLFEYVLNIFKYTYQRQLRQLKATLNVGKYEIICHEMEKEERDIFDVITL